VIDDLTPELSKWPVPTVSASVLAEGTVVARGGPTDWITRIASISKVLTAYAGLVAVDELTIDLDEPAARPGATVRHLLSHAAGYPFNGEAPVVGVGVRRIYSNTGIERFADHLEGAAGMPFGRYLHEGVFEPLGMSVTSLRGSPAHHVMSTASDLARFARELLAPELVSRSAFDEMVTVQFEHLSGVVPGVGRFDPNPWGLGAEIKGDKRPHWSGTATSGATFGHFGGAGTFLWVDPDRSVAVIALTDREFGDWAMTEWPAFSDEMIRRYGASRPGQ